MRPRLRRVVQPLSRKGRPIPVGERRQSPLAYEKLSDPILVTRAKNGDAQALEALCVRHAPRVERLARHLLDDPEDGRDAAQESMAKLCVRLKQFRGEAAFTTWLHRLVVNTCRDVAERQRLRRCEPLPDDVHAGRTEDPARSAGLAELRAELGASLAELPTSQARVVVLKHAFDFSFAEISAASGMPVGTAKCYAHRARNGLRSRLGPADSAVA
jgi:RNA polymerase sigma-70 factor, ECF subfamily